MRRLATLLFLVAAGCGGTVDTAPDESAVGGALTTEERRTMGSFFLVEQGRTEPNARMMQLMASGPPGGLCFWNPGRLSGQAARDVILPFTRAAEAARSPVPLISADYEGGAVTMAPSGNAIGGIQRYVTGMTALAHPRWIGVAHRRDPELGKELARLHGFLMARELRSIGVNYSLGTVSDLARNLFLVRGLDQDPARVATLIGEVVAGALSVEHTVFATKHFPGLGLTRGDTHDEIIVAPAYDEQTIADVLQPFRSAVAASLRTGAEARLSVLASHAKFPAFDPDHNTTTSSKILEGLLRDDLQFPGVVVSDAMWMGPYGHMGTAELMRVYAQTFLAGMDMLMIPGYRYEAALAYFRKLGDDTHPQAEKDALAALVGKPYPELRTLFARRMTASRGRIDAARDAVGYAHDTADPAGTLATSFTTAERTRYYEILKQLDSRLP